VLRNAPLWSGQTHPTNESAALRATGTDFSTSVEYHRSRNSSPVSALIQALRRFFERTKWSISQSIPFRASVRVKAPVGHRPKQLNFPTQSRVGGKNGRLTIRGLSVAEIILTNLAISWNPLFLETV
jgi:hypothetical protein